MTKTSDMATARSSHHRSVVKAAPPPVWMWIFEMIRIMTATMAKIMPPTPLPVAIPLLSRIGFSQIVSDMFFVAVDATQHNASATGCHGISYLAFP